MCLSFVYWTGRTAESSQVYVTLYFVIRLIGSYTIPYCIYCIARGVVVFCVVNMTLTCE
jgi:hypothetical protein